MRPLLYHIIACCAVLFFTACDKEYDIPGGNATGDGNSIILDLSSGSLPISRAVNTEATGAEIRVNHIDVLIFDENGSKKHHERIDGSDTGNGTIVLSAKRSDFEVNAGYEVYLIANSTADVSVFAADDFDMTKLRQLEQTDHDIHMTGCPEAENVPQAFLMDGIAHLDGSTATEVILNDGNMSNDTKLKATLRRAAAKLVIKINKGQFVEFDNSISGAGYYLRNLPYSTSVLTGVNAEAALHTTDLTRNNYFNWTQETEDGPYTLITVTAYAYAHSWDNASSLEKETRLIVNIPMSTILHNEQGDYVDESGAVVDDPVKVPHENSYYQIPVCEGTALERNICYEVSLTLNVPGGTDPSEPVELGPIDYSVREWDEQTIDIGGETDHPAYLYVNEEEFEMHNIDEDYTTLQFSSSSEVKSEITKVYYINKFGQEQALTAIPNTDNEWGVRGGSTYNPTWTNRCTIRITPDEGISGSIDVFSDVPENKTIRYIKFRITNKDGQEREVTVAQYPLEYITNKQSWYSYRDDFKTDDTEPTTYEYSGDRIYGISLATRNISNWNGEYEYEVVTLWNRFSASNSFFTSKYAVEDPSTGKSQFFYYYYDRNNRLRNQSLTEYNARLYHIVLTASSGQYTIGRPRQIYDEISRLYVTDPGKDNAELVSPSFMISSSLSGFLIGGGNLTLDGSDNSLRIAREHCANYVEVAKDGTVYDDWRLPTRAELDIILNYQGTEDEDADAIDYLLNGNYYYHAGGRTYNPNWNVEGAEPRCVRDVYNEK